MDNNKITKSNKIFLFLIYVFVITSFGFYILLDNVEIPISTQICYFISCILLIFYSINMIKSMKKPDE